VASDLHPQQKGRLLHCSGHLETTLPAIPVYTSISLGIPAWLPKVLQKLIYDSLLMDGHIHGSER
jgi:hypothetical protein